MARTVNLQDYSQDVLTEAKGLKYVPLYHSLNLYQKQDRCNFEKSSETRKLAIFQSDLQFSKWLHWEGLYAFFFFLLSKIVTTIILLVFVFYFNNISYPTTLKSRTHLVFFSSKWATAVMKNENNNCFKITIRFICYTSSVIPLINYLDYPK